MKINKGLKYGDDDDTPINPQQYGSTGFEADRNKTNFEKDVDNLLFGNMQPVVRRRKQDGEAAPQSQQKKPTPTPTPPTQIKKPVVQPKRPEPVPSKQINKQPEPKKIQPKKPQPVKKPEPVPPKKIDNYVEQKPQVKQKQVIVQQPKNIKQTDTQEVSANVDNSTFYNRPGYIRKLKKIAEDFNFYQQNTAKHRFIQVLRPSQCIRGTARKRNCPDFEDKQFPPNSTSISFDAAKDSAQWLRPSQIFKSPVFGKYVDPNDIQPGSMSSPQFLSTLSCLAQRQQNIKRLIESQKTNNNGFYVVRINVNGVWRYVPVDDYLPQTDGVAIGARSFNDSQSELWVSLIEKAYAKVYSGYSVFAHSNTPRQHYLRDLTGSPIRKYLTNDQDFEQIINQAIELGFPIVAVPSQKAIQLGFNPNYSFSVLGSNGRGLQLRNSWGTIIQRPKVNISREGVFQLSSNQLRDYISYILIAETDSSLYSTTIQSKHYGSFYSCYSFKLANPNPNGAITISQFDRRLFSEKADYKYVPFRILLQKKNVEDQQNNSLFINAGFSYNSRNLDLAVNLTPGTYYLYCIGEWRNKPYDYDITIFANQLVSITKIYVQNFPNIIAEALTQQNLTKGKRSAKGNVDEYILYHEPSNLVLMTALSLVDRPYNHTLNLQQVKPESLSLINVVKPQDNFAKKHRKDLSSYKQSVFNQKNWEVNLLPHEKYTWIFSSNQDYDPNNFKNWGFK